MGLEPSPVFAAGTYCVCRRLLRSCTLGCHVRSVADGLTASKCTRLYIRSILAELGPSLSPFLSSTSFLPLHPSLSPHSLLPSAPSIPFYLSFTPSFHSTPPTSPPPPLPYPTLSLSPYIPTPAAAPLLQATGGEPTSAVLQSAVQLLQAKEQGLLLHPLFPRQLTEVLQSGIPAGAVSGQGRRGGRGGAHVKWGRVGVCLHEICTVAFG